MWSIGSLHLEGRVVLAPMSGYTSAGYRGFMSRFGASACVTEMVSDAAVLRNPSCREEFLDFEPTVPTGLQLYGHDPQTMADAAVKALDINPSIAFIDVNLCCPAKKVVRKGEGSALLADPGLCGRIVESVKDAVDVPVTAKIRLGRDDGSIVFRELVRILEDSGADAVAVHVRTAASMYSGRPRYDLVRGLGEDMGIPLVISGNIYSPEDAVAAMECTGAQAVMVARGGIGNPFLLTQINEMYETGSHPGDPTVSQQADWCLEMADILFGELGERPAVRRMRSIAPRFVAGCDGCREYRRRLAQGIDDRGSLAAILDDIKEEKGHLEAGFKGRVGIRREDLG